VAEPAARPGGGTPGDGRGQPDGGPGSGPAYRPGHRQEGWDLRFDWGAEGLAAIADGAAVVVVVDVLRFTSAVSVAVGRGAVVLPFPWGRGDAARAYAAGHGAELAGRREHGAWSLSPTDLARLPAGTRLVLPSPNGSALAFAARDGVPGARVLAGCLRNAAAVAAVAGAAAGPVAVVAAGERWHDAAGGSLRPSVEDLLGAGAVLRALVEVAGRPGDSASPEARSAMAAFDAARADLGGWLARSGSGRELASIGFDDDVATAAVLDAEAVAPVLDGPAFSAVVASAAGHLR
jgi:2-phosphosulfolactate phosphatase